MQQPTGSACRASTGLSKAAVMPAAIPAATSCRLSTGLRSRSGPWRASGRSRRMTKSPAPLNQGNAKKTTVDEEAMCTKGPSLPASDRHDALAGRLAARTDGEARAEGEDEADDLAGEHARAEIVVDLLLRGAARARQHRPRATHRRTGGGAHTGVPAVEVGLHFGNARALCSRARGRARVGGRGGARRWMCVS
jgi:hypothetical protein